MTEIITFQNVLKTVKFGAEAARSVFSGFKFLGQTALQTSHIEQLNDPNYMAAHDIALSQQELRGYDPARANDDYREKMEFSTAMLVKAVRKQAGYIAGEPMRPADINTVIDSMVTSTGNAQTAFELLVSRVPRQLMTGMAEIDVTGLDLSPPLREQEAAVIDLTSSRLQPAL